jgi:YD repeat-containing protein
MASGAIAGTTAADVTTMAYDARGNVIETAVNGIKTQRAYDAYNRLTQERDANGNSKVWNYRADGRLLSYKDLTVLGQVSHFSFFISLKQHSGSVNRTFFAI